MSEPSRAGRTVLVVEDDATCREGLAILLQRAGYRVALAANGAAALEHLRGGLLPDLIVLDMLMPVMDGWRFLEAVPKHWPSLVGRTLLTTSGVTTSEWALAHGCAGFVNKPINFDELLEEVRRLCPSGELPRRER